MGAYVLKQPDYPKPNYANACYGQYSQIHSFQIMQIRFGKSRSKNYRKAKYLASLLPNYIAPSVQNDYWIELTIDDSMDLYIYYKVLFELQLLIFDWKYVEYYINSQICYPDEFYVYMNSFSKTLFFPNIEQISVNAKIKEFNDKWKHEKELYSIIIENYSNYTIKRHYRAEWLDNLELDIYIEELNIGIEYQGIQHYKPLKHWGGEEGFITRRSNDIRKKNLCQAHGTKLIEFSYLDEITEELIIKRLEQYLK